MELPTSMDHRIELARQINELTASGYYRDWPGLPEALHELNHKGFLHMKAMPGHTPPERIEHTTPEAT